MQPELQTLIHPLKPIFDEKSEILILGSFPSVESRRVEMYYGNPQNRFWKMLSAVYQKEFSQTNDQKKELTLSCRLALWDVIASCRINGSADSSITEVVPNDLSKILSQAPIRKILLNGKTAARWFEKYQGNLSVPTVVLPSTSPANAAWNLERLCAAWKKELLE